MPTLTPITDHVYRFDDTCHVYAVIDGGAALLIDFGSGAILDALAGIGITTIRAVLMTHHHRDQGQGLAAAAARGIPIHVPHAEQDLFHSVDHHWRARNVDNNYNMRQDRFALLEPVPVAGTLRDYQTVDFGGLRVEVIPTPGHTIGAISLRVSVDGQTLVFCGDLIAGEGQVWSLAATQWTYNGGEGIAATVASLVALKAHAPDLLLPSHGKIMHDPQAAIDRTVAALWELLQARRHNLRLFQFIDAPYRALTPHLLFNQTSESRAYALLSQSGKALLIDFGYDFTTGLGAGTDRGSRRPWLYTIDKLKTRHGVSHIDAVMLTHFHDDHVAGVNLLRDTLGVECWAAENFADILQRPHHYDLPCLWYDPIPVDRVLPLEQAIHWEEYTFTLYALPGHTRYAVAIAFEVDGKRVLASGDQYQGAGDEYNYVYQNDYDIDDYIASAALYRRLNPDLIITGHWEPLEVPPGYFDNLDARGTLLATLHRDLLPLETVDTGAGGFCAVLYPYQVDAAPAQPFSVSADVTNPFHHDCPADVRLTVPAGWTAAPDVQRVTLAAGAAQTLTFTVMPDAAPVYRARIAVDVTVAGVPFGQQAEALVTVRG
jgi:glyoxylase-like metal-dependent hydrolase (beta-lactamase superfamily II)